MFTTHKIRQLLENEKFKTNKSLLNKLYIMRKRHHGRRLHFIARLGLEL
jgi:hypothetical protein